MSIEVPMVLMAPVIVITPIKMALKEDVTYDIFMAWVVDLVDYVIKDVG